MVNFIEGDIFTGLYFILSQDILQSLWLRSPCDSNTVIHYFFFMKASVPAAATAITAIIQIIAIGAKSLLTAVDSSAASGIASSAIVVSSLL